MRLDSLVPLKEARAYLYPPFLPLSLSFSDSPRFRISCPIVPWASDCLQFLVVILPRLRDHILPFDLLRNRLSVVDDPLSPGQLSPEAVDSSHRPLASELFPSGHQRAHINHRHRVATDTLGNWEGKNSRTFSFQNSTLQPSWLPTSAASLYLPRPGEPAHLDSSI